jgi:hypothetical protein
MWLLSEAKCFRYISAGTTLKYLQRKAVQYLFGHNVDIHQGLPRMSHNTDQPVNKTPQQELKHCNRAAFFAPQQLWISSDPGRRLVIQGSRLPCKLGVVQGEGVELQSILDILLSCTYRQCMASKTTPA